MPEWRWRECSDANTAILLARHHDHVALVTESSVSDDLSDGTSDPLIVNIAVVTIDLPHRFAYRWIHPGGVAATLKNSVLVTFSLTEHDAEFSLKGQDGASFQELTLNVLHLDS